MLLLTLVDIELKSLSVVLQILYEHLATFRIQIKEKKIFPHYDNEKPNPCGIGI